MDEELVVYPLEEEVDSLVISLKDRCIQRLIDTSNFDREVTGYLVSAVHQGDLLLLGITTSAIGEARQVTFDNSYFPLQNEFLKKAKAAIPSLVTILYHNHPKPGVGELDSGTIRHLQAAIEAGMYDYLKAYGIEPTLENVAVEELTRHLSPDDVHPGFGRVSVVLTNTYREGDAFSPINAYRLNSGEHPLFDRLKVVSLESKGASYIKTYSELIDSVELMHWEVAKKHLWLE